MHALPRAPARRRVGFLYIAQAHQTLHSVTAALDLARRRPDLRVDLITTSRATYDYLGRVVEVLGGAPLSRRLIGPEWLRRFADPAGTPPKLPMLAACAHELSRYDVLVTPERTTAALRRLGVTKPRLVYTQHGAGDRGGPFEPRLKTFDLVFAAGPKQRDRMAEAGLVPKARCAVVGYPKFDAVDALRPSLPRLFASERPIVLYNPHFDPRLSSWPAWAIEVLGAFADQDRYNLIFAPHIRLFGGAPAASVPELAPFLRSPSIHIDLGSEASIDMTYTRLADVYLGDASSQVYEFLRVRKPCLFLNAHHVPWRGDESYRHWTFGPVLDSPADLLGQVDAARSGHAAYLPAQDASYRETFDDRVESASTRAALAIEGLLPTQTAAVEAPIVILEPA